VPSIWEVSLRIPSADSPCVDELTSLSTYRLIVEYNHQVSIPDNSEDGKKVTRRGQDAETQRRERVNRKRLGSDFRD